MFYTRLGQLVAALALILGLVRVAGGLLIATDVVGPYEAALARYFGSASSSGEVITTGLYMVVFGIVLGILAEIRSAFRNKV